MEANLMRILVVDNEELIRRFVSEVLTSLGHNVVEASNGQEAVEIVEKREGFDAIVTDNNMPLMTGTKFLRWFRTKFEPIPVTRLVLMSGHKEADAQSLCEDFGDVKFVYKPFSLKELRESLQG
jgi:two-component system, cell cycle sensor histidine kinase and response regulator CckA